MNYHFDKYSNRGYRDGGLMDKRGACQRQKRPTTQLHLRKNTTETSNFS